MGRNSPSATSSETSSTALTRPPSKLLPTCAKAIRGALCIEFVSYPPLEGESRRPCNVRRGGGKVSPCERCPGAETVTPPRLASSLRLMRADPPPPGEGVRTTLRRRVELIRPRR